MTVPEARYQASSAERGRTKKRTGIYVLGIAVLALLAGIYAEIHHRARAAMEIANATSDAAIPTVKVLQPTAHAPNEQLVLPGNTQAFTDTPIYARTSGYLKKWHVDIGAQVKQGDLLAEIETPEIDQQLRQSLAELATAEANLQLADITAKRSENLFKTQSVAQQERDNNVGAFNVAKTTVLSRQADVARLKQLQSYEKVYAPFDGVVTARNTDVGDLIDAGAGTPTRELFHIAAIKTLRVYVAIPEIYARAAPVGASVIVTFDAASGEKFNGTVMRNANAIDTASRTLNVEIDVDNAKAEIMPGASSYVHLTVPGDSQTFTVPANVLLFRKEGLQVGIVRDGKALLVPVKIGRDFGDSVEIVSGLAASDQVILDPSDSLVSGTTVRVDVAPAAG